MARVFDPDGEPEPNPFKGPAEAGGGPTFDLETF